MPSWSLPCAAAGIAAFTGDGTNPKVMEGATAAIAANGGFGIPTVKPWDNATVAKKMAMARESGCFALAMDIEARLPFLQNLTPRPAARPWSSCRRRSGGGQFPLF